MLSSNNILSPASGQPIAVPSQDIVLGCYYLTRRRRPPRARAAPSRAWTTCSSPSSTARWRRSRPCASCSRASSSTSPPSTTTRTSSTPRSSSQEPDHQHHGGPRHPERPPARGHALRQRPPAQEGPAEPRPVLLPALRPEKTVEMLDIIKELGFRYATRAGISIGIDDLVIPEEQGRRWSRAPQGRGGRREAVPRRRHHQRRALQQGHRHLVQRHREGGHAMFKEMEKTDEDGRRVQPDLHHGRLRRPRLQAADPPAGRHARPDGAPVRRDHREPDHLELPRRPHRAAVLHLHARRPQGPGRHRAEDGRLRLPDPPPGGRDART